MAEIVREQDKMLGTGRSYGIQYRAAGHIVIEGDQQRGSITEIEREIGKLRN